MLNILNLDSNCAFKSFAFGFEITFFIFTFKSAEMTSVISFTRLTLSLPIILRLVTKTFNDLLSFYLPFKMRNLSISGN